MESDGAAQRARIRELLTAQEQRAEAAVAAALQLSNFSNLTPYVLGSDRQANDLPVASVRHLIGYPAVTNKQFRTEAPR